VCVAVSGVVSCVVYIGVGVVVCGVVDRDFGVDGVVVLLCSLVDGIMCAGVSVSGVVVCVVFGVFVRWMSG